MEDPPDRALILQGLGRARQHGRRLDRRASEAEESCTS